MSETSAVAHNQVARAIDTLEGKLNLAMSTYFEACTHCGLCAEACHLYRADPVPKHIPSYKADTVRKVYQRYFTPVGRLLPWLVGTRNLVEQDLDDWVETVYQCTMCRRCTLECPLGIDNASMIAAARTLVAQSGKAPPTLVEHAKLACDTGSPLGVTREQFEDRIEWIEEELQEELDDDDFTVPLDVEGADLLFIPASLELMKYPQTVQACLKILHLAGVSWTLSTERFDITNFGVFLGDPELTKTIAMRDIEEAKRLGVKILVTSECGHAYRALRWEAPDWFQEELPFRVKNIVELADEWVAAGTLTLEPSANPKPVTYHDPCNITRNGGVIDEPRRLLDACTEKFFEMTPNREHNWCCGGGGGFHSMPEYKDVRLQSGLMKSRQIRAAEAEIVATTCANCQIQLSDLSEHYELGVECVSVTELVAESLVGN